MSAIGDSLPPKDAPLSERLTAAMTAAGYRSDRKLALELGMADGSLVGKWRRGKVRRIQSHDHQKLLADLLKTHPDYFVDDRSQADLREELEAKVDDMAVALDAAKKVTADLRKRVAALEAAERSRRASPAKPRERKRA